MAKTEIKAPLREAYRIIVEPANGIRINGKRFAKGDIHEMTQEEATFLLLEGRVEKVEDAAPKKAGAAASSSEGAVN